MMNAKEAGYMMTQYEQYGSCGRNEYIQMYIDEELDIDIQMLPEYNEYLSNMGHETFMNADELAEYLSGLDPWVIIQKAYFGDFRYSDEYFRFNGYANIDSYDEYQVVKEMREDKSFLQWYVETYCNLDESEIEAATEECNNLLAAGF